MSSCKNDEIYREPISLGKTVKIYFETEESIIGEPVYQWYFGLKPEDSRAILLVDGEYALFTPDSPGDYDILISVLDEDEKEVDNMEYNFIVEGSGKIAEEPIPDETEEPILDETGEPLPDDIIVADSIDIKPDSQATAVITEQIIEQAPPEDEIIVEEEKIQEPIAPSDTSNTSDTSDTPSDTIVSVIIDETPSAQEISEPTPIIELVEKDDEIQQQILNVKRTDRFTVQISAKETLDEAVEEAQKLKEDGYLPYIERVYLDEFDKVYYRVRTGQFYYFGTSKAVKSDLKKTTKIDDVWIDYYPEN